MGRPEDRIIGCTHDRPEDLAMTTSEVQRVMLSQMAAIRDDIRDLRSDLGHTREVIAETRTDLAVVKTRSRIWGAIAGGVLGVAASIAGAIIQK